MIQFIAVTNPQGSETVIPLGTPTDNGFAILNIDGLGPAKGTINVTDISSSNGAIFNSSRVGTRNIVLTLGFVEDYKSGRTIEDVRHKTYEYFPVGKQITLRVMTDKRHATISGYVEYNDPKIFSAQETSEVSIICPDPFFYAVPSDSDHPANFSSAEGGFDFAFHNDSLTNPLLDFSLLKILEERNLYYSGDADTGVTIHIHAIGEATNVLILKTLEYKTLKIDTTRFANIAGITDPKIIAGDDILVDTRRGHKTAELIRGGKTFNIINAIDRNSDWLELNQGDNVFAYKADTGQTNLQIRLEYYTVYEGI